MRHYPYHDDAARALGAVAYHDDIVVKRSPWYPTTYPTTSWHFARYYFDAQGMELAYFIPDLVGFRPHDAPLLNVHPVPRVWGFDHDSVPL